LGQAPNRIAVARANASADLIDLTRANPTRVGLAWSPERLVQALSRPENACYEAAPFGLKAAREAVSRVLPVSVEPDRVLVCASTSEAYALLFKVLCDPGDRVLALAPSYPLFEHLARLEGVTLATCPLAYDGAWHVDLDAVRRAITSDTRAILIVHPNNPTGTFLSPSEIDGLAAFGLPLIVDEVFARYAWGEPPALPSILARPEIPSVALGGLSKQVGLPQMKASWAILNGPRPFRSALSARLEAVCDAYLSVGTPVQHALPALLADPDGVGDAILARVRCNLRSLDAALTDRPIRRLHAHGGWYAMLSVPRTQSETQWVLAGIAAGVAVQPGWFYDCPSSGMLVVSRITPTDRFEKGIRRLLTLF
jgi:aspartate/methionine/tyrosine aminotransferase